MQMKKWCLVSAVLAVLFMCACSKGKNNLDMYRHFRADFISLDKISTVTIGKIRGLIGPDVEIDSLNFSQKLKYDVDAYKLTYYTSYEDKAMVPCESLLLIPKNVKEVKLAAYMHGTVVPAKSLTDMLAIGVPSTFDGDYGSQDVRQCGLPLASAGYCVIMPDYTGYGPTARMDHPFIYYPELFKSAIDGVICAQRTLRDKFKMEPGKDLWLCGWSQGGGMALYAQRELENNTVYRDMFNVRCTSTLAGPFNVRKFILDVLENPDKPYLMMMLYSWAGYSINRFAPQLQRPNDQIFRLQIYDQTDAFLVVGSTPRDLFTGFFIQHIQDGTDVDFIKALDDDTTSEGWTPKAPVFLHHGKDDSVVPCFNSETAYEGLKHSGVVELHVYPGQDHTTFVPAYASATIDEFDRQ